MRGKDKKQSPVTGLHFYRAESGRAHVLVATPTRLFRFSGASTSAAVDNSDFSLINVLNCGKGYRPLLEQPGGQLRHSVFTCGPGLVPNKYAWVTDHQVWTGPFDFSSKTYAVGEKGDVLPLPESASADSDPIPPNSLVLTEFHALLSYPDRVVGISLLNKGVMFVDDFKSSKKIRGMTRDLTTGKIYAFCEYDVLEYAVDREERNVWRDYLHKAQTNPAYYDLALKYCAEDEDKMDEVKSFCQ